MRCEQCEREFGQSFTPRDGVTVHAVTGYEIDPVMEGDSGYRVCSLECVEAWLTARDEEIRASAERYAKAEAEFEANATPEQRAAREEHRRRIDELVEAMCRYNATATEAGDTGLAAILDATTTYEGRARR